MRAEIERLVRSRSPSARMGGRRVLRLHHYATVP